MLIDTETFGQFAHTALAISEAVKDRQPCLVRKPFEDASRVPVPRDGFRLRIASAPSSPTRAVTLSKVDHLRRLPARAAGNAHLLIRTAFSAGSQLTFAPVASPIFRSGRSRLPLTMMPSLFGMSVQPISVQI